MKFENNPFEEGDRIKVRGHEYIVGGVDTTPINDKTIQWSLERCEEDGPAGLLKPKDDTFVMKEFYEVDEEDIMVIE